MSLTLMPEEGTMPTQPLGTAYDIQIVGDENGFELHFSTGRGDYVVNVHGIAELMLDEVNEVIGGWLSEGEAARRTRPVTDDADAYPADDPKHPNWHSVHVDHYDNREKGS